MSNGRVTHAEHHGVHVLRYVGRVGYPLAPAIRAFVEGVLDGPGLEGVVVDLSEAENLDSTNLGLLVRLGMRAKDRGRTLLVVPGGPELRDLLHALGIDELLDMTDEAPAAVVKAAPGTAIKANGNDKRVLRQQVLEAHRTLMAISEANEERFRDVVVWLEAEADEDSRRVGASAVALS